MNINARVHQTPKNKEKKPSPAKTNLNQSHNKTCFHFNPLDPNLHHNNYHQPSSRRSIISSPILHRHDVMVDEKFRFSGLWSKIFCYSHVHVICQYEKAHYCYMSSMIHNLPMSSMISLLVLLLFFDIPA